MIQYILKENAILMFNQFIFYIVSFIVLLFFSGFFSGSETAYFSITSGELAKLKKSNKKSSKVIVFLLSNSKQLLISIIIGNTVVNVSLASIAAILAHTIALRPEYQLNHTLVLFLDVVIVTLVLLIVSEIIPKVIAVENSKKFAALTSYPLMFFYFLFFPIAYIAHLAVSQLQQSVLNEKHKTLSDSEIRTLVEIGAEKGTLEPEETEMLTSLFEFGETVVKEIMKPRPDMICVDINENFNNMMDIVTRSMYSRIPVYKDKIDEIAGIMYIKDLLPFLGGKKSTKFNLQEILHSAYYVPENKKIQELLKEFQAEKIHMAIVVDEYGAVQGLITLEDVIEEIVGEIQDEYDKEETLIKKISENKFVMSGKFDLEEAEDILKIKFESDEEDIETLGGFLLNIFQNIPREGDSTEYAGFRFLIKKVESKRIDLIEIEKVTNLIEKKGNIKKNEQ